MTTTTYTLQYPVQFNDTTVTAVEIRRPKGRDMKGIKDIESLEGSMLLYARLTGQPMHVIEEMDMWDLTAISKVAQGFLPIGQKTGESALNS
ncbi:hypothetical protein VF14_18400 [Nostoc linckia z18]|uniref:Phage tail assembly protein n=2 Tax=Nostoc linckia TaxID=92942 RepID=A0A9Q6EJH9_NOSLI|nr:phage tail assembly protein [Nostoc linckia]PHJ81964.1 hypothetical protein VF07_29130 [Nostoc linckia z6]PHJ92862.1 hypothetical protein VF04_27845 [Nostoc linckia z7]PHK00815.1 hypothetical protein VF08_23400 [Nostoc linckia z8]PHK09307.1 hypothetical protein VF09_15905 [Nostoc linckia z9]PHK33089.1 hypothetical protein VF14_18400 [Nostoc linckia z18]